MIIDTDLIKKLLASNESAYSIESETGISRMTLTNYRNGKADFNNMTLKNAKKICDYAKEIFKMEKLIEILTTAGMTNLGLLDILEEEGKLNIGDYDNLDFIDEINTKTDYTAYYSTDHDGVMIEK